MAGRDGFVAVFTHFPVGLRYLVEAYQKDRNLISFSAALRELLETHPEIASRARKMYAEMDAEPHPEGLEVKW